MTKNPIVNALSASGYIVLVTTVLNILSQTHGNKPDTAFTPVAFLSLFTLSAVLMGYFFLYQPVTLYIDGKKKVAKELLVKTILSFAVITAFIFVLLFLGL